MKKIVFSDVDGTLLDSSRKLLPSTLEAITRLSQNGIPFVIISARSPSGIYPIMEEYKFKCPITSYSGALVLDDCGKVIFTKGLSEALSNQIIDFIESSGFDLSWCIYALDQWIVKDRSDRRIQREESIVRAVSSEGTVNTAHADEINKILCICDPERILSIEKQLCRAFPMCSIVKSSDILLEIMEKGINKETGVRTLCGKWGIPVENAVAFGDNYNDVEMLEAVGHGYIMGNAPAELLSRISLHTDDNDHNGIYNALNGLGWI